MDVIRLVLRLFPLSDKNRVYTDFILVVDVIVDNPRAYCRVFVEQVRDFPEFRQSREEGGKPPHYVLNPFFNGFKPVVLEKSLVGDFDVPPIG